MFFRVLVHSGIKTLAAAPSGDGIFAWKGGCLVIYHWINGILLASSKFGQRQLEKLGDLISWLLMRTTYFNYIIWLLKETRNLWVNCWNMIFKQERMLVSILVSKRFLFLNRNHPQTLLRVVPNRFFRIPRISLVGRPGVGILKQNGGKFRDWKYPRDAEVKKYNHRYYRIAGKFRSGWLAQLGERRSTEREVAGPNPGRTNTQGL